jgi:hypothetical protein
VNQNPEHSIVVTFALLLGYEGLNDLALALWPFIKNEPLACSIVLNIILLMLLFNSKRKKTRGKDGSF